MGRGLEADAPQNVQHKLRLSSKSSKKFEGPTYTPVTNTTAGDRSQLFHQYLMEHGKHILSISTLQQESLQHFVMPGTYWLQPPPLPESACNQPSLVHFGPAGK